MRWCYENKVYNFIQIFLMLNVVCLVSKHSLGFTQNTLKNIENKNLQGTLLPIPWIYSLVAYYDTHKKIWDDGTIAALTIALTPSISGRQLFLSVVRMKSGRPILFLKHTFYVYSAFVERRKRAAVRVIGVTKITAEDQVFCHLWLSDNRTYRLQAEVKPIKEHHNRYYGAIFILCLLNNIKPEETVDGSVSILSSPKNIASNLLKIMDTTPKSNGQTNIHVCVRPLHDSYNEVKWIVEWIELNRILGVSHFYFYNMSIGDQLDCMLRNYPNHKELFTVLSFQFYDLHLWMEGQLASNHDCLYRSVPKADWLLLIDLDEMIVPHNKGIQMLQQSRGKTVEPFPSMFKMLSDEADVDPYAFLFRNTFFYQGWDDDPKSPAALFTSRKTRRSKHVYWYGIRSKYAVRPSKAIELGVHNVEEFESGIVSYNTFQVDPEMAVLHHYRNECAEPHCYEQPYLVDRAAHRWSKRLWKRVQAILKQINTICRLRN